MRVLKVILGFCVVVLGAGASVSGDLSHIGIHRLGTGEEESAEEETSQRRITGQMLGFGASGVVGYARMGDFLTDRSCREYFSETGDWERTSYSVPHLGYGWGMELTMRMPNHVWLGFGFEQLRGQSVFEVTDTLYEQSSQGVYDLNQTADITATPITFTVGAHFPRDPLVLYGGMGMGLYHGNLKVVKKEDFQELGFSYEAALEASMSSAAVGVHLVGGAEIFVTRNVAFYGQGLLRLAKLYRFEGNMSYRYSDSDLNSFQRNSKAYAIMNDCPDSSEEYLSVEPDEPGPTERWMAVDFSGAYLEVGARYYFPLGN
jgi:hypothetical protein